MRLVVEIGKKYPEITGPMSDAFAAELQKIVSAGDFTELVLDFEGTKVISSMAMGTLFQVHQKLRDQGKPFHLVNASDKVTHLLRMVNMTEILM